MNYSNRWLVVAAVAFALIFAQGWYANRQLSQDNRQDAARQCASQNATVEILRLFLADHQDLRESVPPAENHPDSLAEIERLLNEAECQP